MSIKKIAIMVWKPYLSIEEIENAIANLEKKPTMPFLDYYLALPTQYLRQLTESNPPSSFVYGATSMNNVTPGSFTEPIAAKMLHQLGAKFVLLGTVFSRKPGEQENEAIRLKILKAIDEKIIPILCIGESLAEYEAGHSEEILHKQLKESSKDFTKREWDLLQIVYEAPWINDTFTIPAPTLLNQAYQLCRNIVQDFSSAHIPVFCGVPDDIKDLIPFVENIPADGYFFSHASLHLELFSEDLHPYLTGIHELSKNAIEVPLKAPAAEKILPLQAKEEVPKETMVERSETGPQIRGEFEQTSAEQQEAESHKEIIESEAVEAETTEEEMNEEPLSVAIESPQMEEEQLSIGIESPEEELEMQEENIEMMEKKNDSIHKVGVSDITKITQEFIEIAGEEEEEP